MNESYNSQNVTKNINNVSKVQWLQMGIETFVAQKWIFPSFVGSSNDRNREEKLRCSRQMWRFRKIKRCGKATGHAS